MTKKVNASTVAITDRLHTCGLCHYSVPEYYGKMIGKYYVCAECLFKLGEQEVRLRLGLNKRNEHHRGETNAINP